MGLIENSKDLLNVVLAFCVLWLTIFLAWFIYYLIMIMRQGYIAAKEMKERLKKIDETIKTFKEKMEHSAMYLSLIGEGIKKIVEIVKEKKDKKSRK